MKLPGLVVFALATLVHVSAAAQVNRAAAEAAQAARPAASVAAHASPQVAAASRQVFQGHASAIATVKQQTLTPQQLSRFTPSQQARLRQSVDRLAKANEAFSANEQAMRPKQRLLAEVQIDLATAALRRTAAVRGPGGPQPTVLLRPPVELSAGAEKGAQAISMPPLDVQIKVSPVGGKPAEAMDVYVLPIGVVQYGAELEATQIRNVIEGLMFRTPTSPAQGDLERGYVYAVWVGSRNAVDAMALLVKQGKLKYRTIMGDGRGPLSVTFEASEQVVAR